MKKFKEGQIVKTKAFGKGIVVGQKFTVVTINFNGDIKDIKSSYVFDINHKEKVKEQPMFSFDEKIKETEKAFYVKVTHGTAYGEDYTRNMWVPKSLVNGNNFPLWLLKKELGDM